MQKIPCPSCGELNYEAEVVCWACGKPMKERPAPPAAAPSVPNSPPPPAPALTAAELALLEQARSQIAPGVPDTIVPPPPHPAPMPAFLPGTAPPPDPPVAVALTPAELEVLERYRREAAAPPPPEPAAPMPPPAPERSDPERSLGTPAPKPAELEAAALQPKEYVTPPVDVEESPRSPGEWISYAFQSLLAIPAEVRRSLDEYDQRRGRQSGGFSSFTFLAVALTGAFMAVVLAYLVPLLAR